MKTFIPLPAPAPAPAPTPAPVPVPEVYDTVTACDVQGRSGPALVTGVTARDGQPAITVRPVNGDLRLPTTENGLLRYSATPRSSTWRWPT